MRVDRSGGMDAQGPLPALPARTLAADVMPRRKPGVALRCIVVVVGACICALAAWKLGLAVRHALAHGTVLLLDTRPMARGVVYSYPWREVWGYFAGWSLIGVGGLMVIAAVGGRWRLLLGAALALLAGFMLVAAAPMLGSVSGVLLLAAFILGGSLLTALFGLFKFRREHRQLEMEPELQDQRRKENAA